MKLPVVRSAAAVALALGALVACSSSGSSSDSAAYEGSCKELASRCHPVQTTLGQECHDLGHDGDDAKCGPRRAECLAECPEETAHEDAGAPAEDAGGDDAGGDDAGPTPCEAYCACMGATCATEPAYPFADDAACLSACAAFSSEDLTCRAASCEAAKSSSGHDKEHDCEHASGAVACH